MESTSGVAAAEVHTSRGSSYHRTGSEGYGGVSAEHLHADWEGVHRLRRPWIKRDDSTKAHYAASVASVGVASRLRRGFGLRDGRNADVWRAAAVELAASAGLTFLSIVVDQGSGMDSAVVRAFLQALVYSLAILSAAPVSGGHLSPAITVVALVAGRATLVRALLYVAAQLSGGVAGAAVVRFLTTAEVRRRYALGGCVLPEAWSRGQGLAAEAVFTAAVLFVACGAGFDARSVVVTFPIAAPFVIGGAFGLLALVSQRLGYTAAMNPARCLGPAVVHRRELWEPLCAFAVGPVAAAVVVGVFLLLVSPARGEELAPVLPLNFFQVVVPDHQRPGFGPRSPGALCLDQDIAHSEHFGPSLPAAISTDPHSASRYSLTLQIKAFMQPKGMGSRRVADVARFDQNFLLQHGPGSRGSSDGIGDPEKDR